MKKEVLIKYKNLYHKIFTLTQNKNDGSFYISWPGFKKTIYKLVIEDNNQLKIKDFETPNNSEKLSLHGRGMTGFHGDKGSGKGGAVIFDPENKTHGIRHLITAQICQPFEVLPEKPVPGSNKYIMRESDSIPSILIFFAIPKINLELSVMMDIDNVDEFFVPEVIELESHSIIILSYSIKNYTWPSKNYVFYDRGFRVPVILGQGGNKCKFEIRPPIYNLNGNNLEIDIPSKERREKEYGAITEIFI